MVDGESRAGDQPGGARLCSKAPTKVRLYPSIFCLGQRQGKYQWMYNGPYVLPVNILRLINLSTETSEGMLCLRSFNLDYKKLRNYNKPAPLSVRIVVGLPFFTCIGTLLVLC